MNHRGDSLSFQSSASERAATKLRFIQAGLHQPRPSPRSGRAARPGRSLALPTWAIVVLVASTALALIPDSLPAAGQEHPQRREHDLVVDVDTRWAGGCYGGYYPVRVHLLNKGRERSLTLRVNGAAWSTGRDQAAAERRITLAAGASADVTLLVPLVGETKYGHRLDIEQDGRLLERLQVMLTLATRRPVGYQVVPSLLAISPHRLDTSEFMIAANGDQAMVRGDEVDDTQWIPPVNLPRNWLAYSGLDLVTIGLPVLGRLDEEQRDALVGWAEQGGTLIIDDVGNPPGQSSSLSRLLELDRRAIGSGWQAADPSILGQVKAQPQPVSASVPVPVGDSEPTFNWPAEPAAFAHRQVMLGRVFAFPGSVLPGTRHDWDWFFRSFPRNAENPNEINRLRLTWTDRHGISARSTHPEFLEFTIPGVGQVPVVAFLVLITLFTVVIGPVNYVLLRRRNRLHLMVLTVPAIALVTSLSLLGYALGTHGFGVSSRIRSLTLLDQGTGTAVTTSRVALFAGLAPGGSLDFSRNTGVYTIWGEGQQLASGRVDWTDKQSLSGDWLKTRTRTQFLTVTRRKLRSRLQVNDVEDNRLHVSNGLGSNLDLLLVRGPDGRLYSGAGIPDGKAARLDCGAVTDERVELLMTRIDETRSTGPVEPDEFIEREPPEYVGSPGLSSWDERSTRVRFDSGLMEQYLVHLASTPVRLLTARSYVAILSENPGVEIGLAETSEEKSIFVVYGSY